MCNIQEKSGGLFRKQLIEYQVCETEDTWKSTVVFVKIGASSTCRVAVFSSFIPSAEECVGYGWWMPSGENWLFQQRTSPSNAMQVAAAGCWLAVASDMLMLLRHIEIKWEQIKVLGSWLVKQQSWSTAIHHKVLRDQMWASSLTILFFCIKSFLKSLCPAGMSGMWFLTVHLPWKQLVSRNVTLSFHSVANVQVTTCQGECFGVVGILYLMSFEVRRETRAVHLYLVHGAAVRRLSQQHPLMNRGNVQTHLTMGTEAEGEISLNFWTVRVSFCSAGQYIQIRWTISFVCYFGLGASWSRPQLSLLFFFFLDNKYSFCQNLYHNLKSYNEYCASSDISNK